MTKGVVSEGVDLHSSPAYNVEPVTNTSSSSCANNGRRTPRCARRSPPSVAALFFTVRDSYGWQHCCRPVCSETRYSSRIVFFCLPHLHLTPPLGGGGSRLNIAIPFGAEKLEWLGYPIVKKFRRYLICFDATHERELTNVTDSQTVRHIAWRHRIARQKCRHNMSCASAKTIN